MSATGPEFPAFISLKTKRDAGAEAEFLSAVDSIIFGAKSKLKGFAEESQKLLDDALSVKRNTSGSLDLGVPQLREEVKVQEARAAAAREVATAMTALRAEQKASSDLTLRDIAAAKSHAEAEERDLAVLRAKISVLDQVQDRLNKQASATDMVVAAQRRGTDASGAVTNSVRANRVAMTQLGQQMQDSVIQWQMGTNAVTIFTQQMPQAAFALSGLGGKIGTVARFLSGPFGAGVILATALLGPMVAKLFESEDAADKSGNAIDKLANRLDITKNSYKSLMAVVDDYNKKQDESTAKTYEAITAAETEAKRLLELAKARLANLQSMPHYAGQELGGRQVIDAQISGAAATIKELEKQLGSASIGAADERVKRATDPRYKIETDFNVKLSDLREKEKLDSKNLIDYEAERLKLVNARIAALKKFDESQRKTGSSNYQSGREIDSSQARSIAEAAGFQVNSADRTLAKQKQFYDDWVAKGKPANNPVAFPNANAPHVKGNALDIQFGAGISPASIRKAYAEEGVRLTKVLKEKGHYHIEWSTSGADKVAREADALKQHLEEAMNTVTGIAAQWDDQPRIVDQIAKSVSKLNEIIADPKSTDAIKNAAEAAKVSAQSFIDRDIGKWVEQGNHQLQVQSLLLAGYDDEAAVVDAIYQKKEKYGPLNEAQTAEITRQVALEQEKGRAMERASRIQSAYLDASRSIRGELESLFSGNGANFGQIFKQLQSKVFVEQVFGKMFEDLDKYVKGNTGLDDATQKLVDSSKTSGDALLNLADVVNGVSGRIAGGGTAGGAGSDFNASFDATFGGSAANDNADPTPITVVGVKPNSNSIIGMNPFDFIAQLGGGIGKSMSGALNGLLGTGQFGRLSGGFGGAAAGYMLSGSPWGAAAGGLLGLLGGNGGFDMSGLFGNKGWSGQSQPSGQMSLAGLFGGGGGSGGVGGILGGLGSALPLISILGGGSKAIKNGVTGALAGGAAATLASSLIPGLAAGLGPIGAGIGLVVGLLSSVFSGPKRGTVSFANGSSNVTNNKTADLVSNLSTLGGGVQESLSKIASALGTGVGNYGFTLGMRNDVYRVSGSPNADLQDNIGPLLYQGTDQTAALKAALANAIEDGAIAGLNAFEQRILSSGGSSNIDKAVQDIVDIRGVFKSLKQYTDPVGAALDELDTKFSHLKDVFISNGASAEDYAKLEQLYGLERAKAIKAATDQITGSLRSLYDELTVGNSALSLGDRKGLALAKYNPLADRVRAGDTSAYDDFAASARTLLDLERQMSGSQSSYFDLLNEVTTLTKTTLDSAGSVASASADRPGVFTAATIPANDNQGVIDAIYTTNGYLRAIYEGMIINGGGDSSGFNFAQVY